ncbi:Oidioi.mRNA.OKI2018_I69.PAR.g9029.t1.cds [Oikopleura dioica]|uniref:Oidioi.mRNA.OKI2018_I69.PAR.g9029.t1.cds n=1 Tax=Oikopleura dioica TaxID=34765 RepID=A0ABN7RP35_OIKDI|nr:Oidioi.mRNA.OKI2018_I69.PAR.g9029.t1.cds [Oikopleura dioica]
MYISTGSTSFVFFDFWNFEYANEYPAEDFLREVAAGEVRYLRSVSARRKDLPDFEKDFPTLSADISEALFRPDRQHSQILRISPKNLEIWLHYDTLDNFLTQTVGEKEVLLFPPSDAKNLYLDGDKSECIGLISHLQENQVCFPDLKKTNAYREVLKPGDVLFIPALWFHCTKALNFSVSINTFFKSLPDKMYGKDLYGNRDPLPVEDASKHLQKAIAALSQLPQSYQSFYLHKLLSPHAVSSTLTSDSDNNNCSFSK